jgi:hypothetical protein
MHFNTLHLPALGRKEQAVEKDSDRIEELEETVLDGLKENAA